MRFNLRDKIIRFTEDNKDYPLLVGFLGGFYPLVFYYSNNYESINSWQHLLFFSLLFLLLPSFTTWLLYHLFSSNKNLQPYKRHLLFVLAIEITAVYFSQVYYLTLRKKLLLLGLVFAIVLSYKLYNHYKKIVLFIVLLLFIPLINVLGIIVRKNLGNTAAWMRQDDAIEAVQFIKKPNIYFIEPDGYAGKEAMEKHPYGYNDTIYDWLKSNAFTVYDKTKSNYPASLASNASMFAMKHHYLDRILPSPFEMEDSRSIIVGNNPVISIFIKNNYKCFFIVEDEYFQQNFQIGDYDFYNIQNEEIPFFSNDNDVKKDVYLDLKKCIATNTANNQPRFFFIEKLLPHHIHFDGTGKENERKVYLEKVELTNIWLKKTIGLIEKEDPSAIIIIAADHGGWVGIETMNEMFTTKDKDSIKSIFSNLLAIKWNDASHIEYDQDLKSNVNIFRVLFSFLSEDKKLLKELEDDSSYTIRNDGVFSKKAEKIIF